MNGRQEPILRGWARRWEQGRTAARGGATQVMRVFPGHAPASQLTRVSALPQCLPLSPSLLPLRFFLHLLSFSFLSPILRILSVLFTRSPLTVLAFSGPLSKTFSFLVRTFLSFLSSCLLFFFLPLRLSPLFLCSAVWSPLLPPLPIPLGSLWGPRGLPPRLPLDVISHPQQGWSLSRCCCSTARGN